MTGPSDVTMGLLLRTAREQKQFTIDSEEHATHARTLLKTLKTLENELEDARKAQKAPFLEGGRNVDDAFKPARDAVAKAQKELKAKMDSYLRAVRAAQLAAEREMHRQAEAAAAKTGTDDAPVSGYQTPKLDPDKVPDTKSLPKYSTRVEETLTIYNIDVIPRDYLVPNEPAILAALKAGELIPGCKINREEKVIAR